MAEKTYPLFSDEYYMNEALREARKALERDEVPIGAVVVCNRTIIARAHNLTETLTDATAHAEMQALTAASAHLGGKYLNECSIYITLEPCIMCAGALAWTQIGRVVYGPRDEKRGYSLLKRPILHPRTEVAEGVLAAECSALLTGFFRKKRD